MESILEPVFTTLKDLVKFKIIKSVDTGDKSYDNLITAFLLTLTTLLLTYLNPKKIIDKCKEKRMKGILQYKDYKQIKEKVDNMNSRDFNYCSWYTCNKEFTNKFISFIFKNFGYLFGRDVVRALDTDSLNLTNDIVGQYSMSIKTIHSACSEYTPLFIDGSDIVGISKKENALLLFYNSEKLLQTFLKLIANHTPEKVEDEKDKNKDENKDAKEKKNLFVYDGNGDGDGDGNTNILYPDRNMDMVVTRHKQDIIRVLDTFISIRKGIVPFGGFVSHNLGIMLHGPPGTGKTLMIQAVCNYLQRNARIVDMRNIRTVRDFKGLFTGSTWQNEVFVLDEFDCVQNIIKSRDEKEDENQNENKEENALDKLRNRKLETMKLLGTAEKENSNITRELEQIDREIKDFKSKLRLETMLTVLQGTQEQRGRVIIACTNYIDRIDRALLRDGRFNLKIHLGKFNNEEIRELLGKMFGKPVPEDIKFQDDVYTPAQLVDMATRCGSLEKIIEQIKI